MGSIGGFFSAPRRQAPSSRPGRNPSRVRDALAAQVSAIPWALLAAALTTALLAGGVFVLAVTDRPLSVLVRDANAIAHQPNYFGALEHAGIILMCGAGWIALYTATFCRGQTARFLFLGGLLSLLLATDDLYMLHESSYRFDVPEQFIFALYAALLLLLVAGNLRRFLQSPFVLLGIAMALFAIAIMIDATHYTPFGLPWGTEDCIELAGICFWAVYFVKCSRDGMLEHSHGLPG